MSTKRLTQEEFTKRVSLKFNNTIEVLSDYRNVDTLVKFRCTRCGYIWETTPRKILDKRVTVGCKPCSAKVHGKLSQERFIPSLDDFLGRVEIIPDIEYISGYVNISTPCFWQCGICNHEWSTSPNLVLNHGTKCPNCTIQKLITPVEDIVNLVNELYRGTISYVSGYTNKATRCRWKCNLCGAEWHNTPNNVIRLGSCPSCKMSSGERRIKLLLDEHGVSYIHQYIFEDLKGINGGTLRFDFAILEDGQLSHLIEFDGKQHTKAVDYFGGTEQFEILKQNDKLKEKYCQAHGIKLIRIKYRQRFTIETLRG